MEDQVNEILPSSFDYAFEKAPAGPSVANFQTTIRLKCKTKEELLRWKAEFDEKNKCVWILRGSYPNAPTFQYRTDYVCQYISYHKTAENRRNLVRSKNTFCQASMALKIKRDTRNTRKHDIFVKNGFLSVVVLKWTHNHPLLSADLLSYRQIRDHVKRQLEEYFSKGMSAEEALDFYKTDLELNHNVDELTKADASIWPKMSAVYYLHSRWRSAQFRDHPDHGPSITEPYQPPSPATSISNEMVDAETEIAHQNRLVLKQLLLAMEEKKTRLNDPKVLEGQRKLLERIQQAETASAYASLLCSMGNAPVPVQPTIQRPRMGQRRELKRLSSGRPLRPKMF